MSFDLLRVGLGDLFLRAHHEVGVAAGRDAVALAEQGVDLVLRVLDLFGRGGGGDDHAEALLAHEALLHGRVGRDDHVVLIGAHHAAALFLEHAHDFEGDVLDADDGADGVAVRERGCRRRSRRGPPLWRRRGCRLR